MAVLATKLGFLVNVEDSFGGLFGADSRLCTFFEGRKAIGWAADCCIGWIALGETGLALIDNGGLGLVLGVCYVWPAHGSRCFGLRRLCRGVGFEADATGLVGDEGILAVAWAVCLVVGPMLSVGSSGWCKDAPRRRFFS
ncbi:hypothetical protein Nepgr_021682 [Nepenthes gracilis]|uniref:Uncharacterized protein n=1 Tax=Nepenthes gracilis TaxID=150966 RepID=A0AAD3SZF7_NEPGR|nr:hypothetical protein Nepgr_021682 [Nepenthes gracilis]